MIQKEFKIVCLYDERDIVDLYEAYILKYGFSPVKFLDPRKALEYIKNEMDSIILIICDYNMDIMTGFEFRKLLLELKVQIPFVIISAYITTKMALEGVELKISAFLEKPINEKSIIETIEKYSQDRLEFLQEMQSLENTFLEEAHGILDDVEQGLLSLEADKDNLDVLKLIARNVHTLKGSSGFLSVNTVTKYVHSYEDIVSGLQKGELQFNEQISALLFLGFDRIKELIQSIPLKTLKNYNLNSLLPELNLKPEVTAQKNEPETNLKDSNSVSKTSKENALTQKNTQKSTVKDTLSVPVSMLDELSYSSGEITVLRNMVNKIVRSLEVQYINNKDVQNLGELLEEMHKINGTIQTRIVDLRKVPLSHCLKSIPRMVHDLCRSLGKKVELDLLGETLRVDNSLVSVCNHSLVHLIRNSIDHGIEMPEDRKRAGKNESGKVFIHCSEERDEIRIKIRDDGHGINYLKIKSKALEKELFTEAQLDKMSETQILDIIFSSGFSTAAQVTDVSGRGVGMDMVKSSVEAVGGQIQIETKVGLGTTFTLKLPIPKSVLIINSLLVEAGERCFAIPQDSIIHILRLEQDQTKEAIYQIATGMILKWADTIYPLLYLNSILTQKNHIDQEILYSRDLEILIVRSDDLVYALLVDSILDSEEIVVKMLEPYLNYAGIYTGATFMGDGTIGLILDLKGIAKLGGIHGEIAFAKEEKMNQAQINAFKNKESSDFENYLLFYLGNQTLYGTPLSQVFRLEEFNSSQIKYSGSQEVAIYREKLMSIYSLNSILNIPIELENSNHGEEDKIPLVVIQGKKGTIGLKVSQVLDIMENEEEISDAIRDRIGIMGNTFMRGQIVTILDLPAVLENYVYHDQKSEVC